MRQINLSFIQVRIIITILFEVSLMTNYITNQIIIVFIEVILVIVRAATIILIGRLSNILGSLSTLRFVCISFDVCVKLNKLTPTVMSFIPQCFIRTERLVNQLLIVVELGPCLVNMSFLESIAVFVANKDLHILLLFIISRTQESV